MSVGLVIAIFFAFLCAVLAFRFFNDARTLRRKYDPILNVEAELVRGRERIKAEAESADRGLKKVGLKTAEQENLYEKRRTELAREYKEALSRYEALKLKLSLLEENEENISFGLYKPHFDFTTSEEFKAALEEIRERQRVIIRNGQAAVCDLKWTVGESEKEGARMVKQYIKLVVRAFNGESDAAVANVKWNNATRMEERLKTAWKALNELGAVMKLHITQEYLTLKLKELWLTHELEEKRHQEREDERRIRERIHDEEKAKREFEKAKEEAQKEEERYQKALEKAKEEASQATGAHLDSLNQQLQALQHKLDEARANKERAISRAQMTKSGFVYVISNIGSFGEEVFKIGMTRRLDPRERVTELSDAAVPFAFDIHAVLYSENAPELEHALHQYLESHRVNLVNPRKEFFMKLELNRVREFAKSRGIDAEFLVTPEAKEYRQSLILRSTKQPAESQPATPEFPAEVFGASAG